MEFYVEIRGIDVENEPSVQIHDIDVKYGTSVQVPNFTSNNNTKPIELNFGSNAPFCQHIQEKPEFENARQINYVDDVFNVLCDRRKNISVIYHINPVLGERKKNLGIRPKSSSQMTKICYR